MTRHRPFGHVAGGIRLHAIWAWPTLIVDSAAMSARGTRHAPMLEFMLGEDEKEGSW